MRHRTAAAEIVKQATLALPEFGGGNLVSEVHVAGAPGLRKAGEEGLRPLELVERQIAATPRSHRHHDLRDPVRMRGASGHVDDRQTRLRFIAGPQETAVLALEELQALAVGRIWRRRGNATPGRAVADRHGITRYLGKIRHPILHRPAGEAIPFAGAVRRIDDRALE